jgi:hypothetical protein
LAAARLVFLLVFALGCAASQAQPTRVRGTISGFDGKTLTVDGKTQVLVGEKTEIVLTQPTATVGAMVQATSGRELTMTYEGGSQKIVVPESASISTLVPGNPKQLVPGAPVNLTMDAERVALRIQVGPKAPKGAT